MINVVSLLYLCIRANIKQRLKLKLNTCSNICIDIYICIYKRFKTVGSFVPNLSSIGESYTYNKYISNTF